MTKAKVSNKPTEDVKPITTPKPAAKKTTMTKAKVSNKPTEDVKPITTPKPAAKKTATKKAEVLKKNESIRETINSAGKVSKMVVRKL